MSLQAASVPKGSSACSISFSRLDIAVDFQKRRKTSQKQVNSSMCKKDRINYSGKCDRIDANMKIKSKKNMKNR